MEDSRSTEHTWKYRVKDAKDTLRWEVRKRWTQGLGCVSSRGPCDLTIKQQTPSLPQTFCGTFCTSLDSGTNCCKCSWNEMCIKYILSVKKLYPHNLYHTNLHLNNTDTVSLCNQVYEQSAYCKNEQGTVFVFVYYPSTTIWKVVFSIQVSVSNISSF